MIGIGTKVVCIEDCRGLPCRPTTAVFTCPNGAPKKGEVFVVGGFYTKHMPDYMGLVLIGKPGLSNGNECGWLSTKFAELEYEQMRAELSYYRTLPVHQPLKEGV